MDNTISQLLESGASIQLNVDAKELKSFALDILREFNEGLKQPEPEVYVSVASASQQLGVDRTTLWKWNKEGYFKAVKIGKKVQYKQSDIDRLKQTR